MSRHESERERHARYRNRIASPEHRAKEIQRRRYLRERQAWLLIGKSSKPYDEVIELGLCISTADQDEHRQFVFSYKGHAVVERIDDPLPTW